MPSNKYTFIRAEKDELNKVWYLYYQNGIGGAIYLVYDGYSEPKWDNLPADFPRKEALLHISQLK